MGKQGNAQPLVSLGLEQVDNSFASAASEDLLGSALGLDYSGIDEPQGFLLERKQDNAHFLPGARAAQTDSSGTSLV
jgi:hypothetical protein